MKKICVVTTNRADYGRLKPVMELIQKDPRLELQVVAATHLYFDHFIWSIRHNEPLSLWRSLPWYFKARGMTIFGKDAELESKEHLMSLLVADGFKIHARLPIFLEGGNLRVMTKSIGLTLLGLPDVFQKLQPNVVLINGDRFEMLPIAFTAVSLNIHLAHMEGGDVSGTLDESTRHAITKLAHIHFPSTPKSGERIRAMGEPPERIYVTGSPVIDELTHLDLSPDNSIFDRYTGGGERIDFTKPFILIIQHPVTTRYEDNKREMNELIATVDRLPMQKLFLAPNLDAGSDGISAAIRAYSDSGPDRTAFFKHLHYRDFYRVLNNATVAVGNSSSFIREGAYLGTPAVLVGNRQLGRERGKNVIEVPVDQKEITLALEKQIAHGRYDRDLKFGDGKSSQRIVDILRHMDFSGIPLQKNFYEYNSYRKI